MLSNIAASAIRPRLKLAPWRNLRRRLSFLSATTAPDSTRIARTNYSACFNDCTARRNLKALESGWPLCDASSPGTAGGPGPKANWTAAPPFTLRCPEKLTGMSKNNGEFFGSQLKARQGFNLRFVQRHLAKKP